MISTLLLAAVITMQLHAGDFVPGGAIPQALMATDCGGANRTPALAWHDAPKQTRSFALILHDPDAPVAGGFDHWILYDLPPSLAALDGGTPPLRGRIGRNSTGRAAYFGPCPPPGPKHHYVFTLYALDERSVGASAPLTGAQLRRRIAGHVIAEATLEATAAHP